MTNSPRLVVDLISDPVCPWCYVGLRSFFITRDELSKDFEVVTRLRPYLLNPNTPKEGVDRQAYYLRKFPDAAQRDASTIALKQTAENVGFNFDPSTPKILPNSIDAHRLLRWAHFSGRHEETALDLYKAFWDLGEDIGKPEKLAAIGENHGFDKEKLSRDLESDKDVDLIKLEARQFSEAGVTGVPTYIINEQVGFSGAMVPEQLENGIRQAAAQSLQASSKTRT